MSHCRLATAGASRRVVRSDRLACTLCDLKAMRALRPSKAQLAKENAGAPSEAFSTLRKNWQILQALQSIDRTNRLHNQCSLTAAT